MRKILMFKEVFILFFLTFLFVSCGQDEVVEKKKQRTINITTSLVQIYNFKDQESAIGTIEGLMDPTIRSEIASSVKKIYTKTHKHTHRSSRCKYSKINA